MVSAAGLLEALVGLLALDSILTVLKPQHMVVVVEAGLRALAATAATPTAAAAAAAVLMEVTPTTAAAAAAAEIAVLA